MQNGIIFSSSCGTRNSEVSANRDGRRRHQSRGSPDHLDVIDQNQKKEELANTPTADTTKRPAKIPPSVLFNMLML